MKKLVQLNFVHFRDEANRPAVGVQAINLRTHEVEKSGSIGEVGNWLKSRRGQYVAGTQAAWICEAA